MIVLGSLFNTYPTHPAVEEGKIVVWNNHGSYHYITKSEDELFDVLWKLSWGAFVVICVGTFLEQSSKR